MTDIKGYFKLIKKANPDFIEVKAYMHVGQSRQNLERTNMPLHNEIKAFVKKLNKSLKDYEIASEHKPSRVVMLARKKFKKQGKWHTFIDFQKFFRLLREKKIPRTQDYLAKTERV